MDFSGSVVVVVGGSGGLGEAFSRFMASHGAAVAVLYHGRAQRAQDIASSIRDGGGKARAFQVDAARRESVDVALSAILEAFGTVDVLINSAGISRNGVTWKVRDEDWESTLSVNLTGAFQWTRAVLPLMREKGKGRIVNISSIVGNVGVAGTAAYAATKAGIDGLTRATATEVARRGITVNSLALGYFDAGIISDVPPDKLAAIVGTIPVGRLGRLDEVCHTVGFLCTKEAAYITGQTLHVNGGLYLG
jgi:3-oxoacyl-[acyl-carrier protein] reductase